MEGKIRKGQNTWEGAVPSKENSDYRHDFGNWMFTGSDAEVAGWSGV